MTLPMRSFITIIIFFFSFISLISAQLEEVPKYCTGIDRDDRTSISVSEFTFSAMGANRDAGIGLKKMLSNALVECGCFRVVERAQLKSAFSEQELALSGSVRRGTGARTGQITGAQVTILADVTEFKENESGFGLGGFTRKLGICLLYTSPSPRDRG